MAQHMKRTGMPTAWRVVIIVLSVLVTLSLLLTVCVYSGLFDKVASIFSSTEPTVDVVAPSTTTTADPLPTPEPVYRKPDLMKGVWLTPGKDYYTSKTDTAESVKKQIDEAFTYMADCDYNTLILPLDLEERAVYPTTLYDAVNLTDKEGASFDPVQYALSRAREKELFVYLVLDMHVRDGEQWDPRTQSGQALTLNVTEEVLNRYTPDGYFITGFTFSTKQVSDEERIASEKALTDLITAVTGKITSFNRNLYRGLVSNGIWAHKSVNELGSDTGEYYEEFTDGCADTYAWLKTDLFNCVIVQNYSSTVHPTAPFQKVLSWWGKVAEETEKNLYISHAAYRLSFSRLEIH